MLSISEAGIRMRVRVTPKASANRILGVVTGAEGEKRLKVQVTAVPEAGRANAALTTLLARHLHVPKSAVAVVAGATDRRKTIEVAGDPALLIPHLEPWLETGS